MQIFVVDAGDEDEQASRPDLSVLEDISDQSDSSGSSSDSDDLDSDSEDEEERMRKRRSVGEDGESHEVDDEEDELSRRRRRRRQKRKQKELNEQIQDYYSVTYYGATAASYMFKLASQLNHKDNKLLWLNIVAVTDYYVFERYTGEQYHDKVELLQHEVGRLNMQPEEDDRSGAPEQDRIAFTEEFRFMVRLPHPPPLSLIALPPSGLPRLLTRGEPCLRQLPRFWSLYESMSHSSYVACRLGLWKEPGKLKLDTLLAQMGIPLAACKQRYSHMSAEHKRWVRERLPDFAERFGLPEIQFGSFEKFDGFRSKLSGADVVYGVNALLEETGGEDEDQLTVTTRNFWRAYSALASEREAQDVLQRGCELSIRMQQMIVTQGKIVIDKNSVSDCGKNFQWITMSETVGSSPPPCALPLCPAQLVLTLGCRWTRKCFRSLWRWAIWPSSSAPRCER